MTTPALVRVGVPLPGGRLGMIVAFRSCVMRIG